MAGFFKIALRNFFHAPTTDPYPFGETFLPDTYRGIIAWDKDTCIGCSTCQHVCPTGAIRVAETDDGEGISFSYWLNSCTLCGNCGFFCPTNAVHHTTNFHTVTLQKEKYDKTVYGEVALVGCRKCSTKIRPMVELLLERSYGIVSDEERSNASLCPECRRMKRFEELYK